MCAKQIRHQRGRRHNAEQTRPDRISRETPDGLQDDRQDDRLDAIEDALKLRNLCVAHVEPRARERDQKRRDDEAKEASRLKAIADQKAADKKHQAEVNNAILKALIENGIDEAAAKAVICAVAKGRIPGMSINY